MRVVLDTSVIVAALRSRSGASWEVLRHVLCGTIETVMDLKLSLEYEDVCLRPDHLQKSALDHAEVLTLLETLKDRAHPIPIPSLLRPILHDPNDEMLLELAFFGHVAAIVTHNTRHLLPARKRFGIGVITPAQLLHELRTRVR